MLGKIFRTTNISCKDLSDACEISIQVAYESCKPRSWVGVQGAGTQWPLHGYPGHPGRWMAHSHSLVCYCFHSTHDFNVTFQLGNSLGFNPWGKTWCCNCCFRASQVLNSQACTYSTIPLANLSWVAWRLFSGLWLCVDVCSRLCSALIAHMYSHHVFPANHPGRYICVRTLLYCVIKHGRMFVVFALKTVTVQIVWICCHWILPVQMSSILMCSSLGEISVEGKDLGTLWESPGAVVPCFFLHIALYKHNYC